MSKLTVEQLSRLDPATRQELLQLDVMRSRGQLTAAEHQVARWGVEARLARRASAPVVTPPTQAWPPWLRKGLWALGIVVLGWAGWTMLQSSGPTPAMAGVRPATSPDGVSPMSAAGQPARSQS